MIKALNLTVRAAALAGALTLAAACTEQAIPTVFRDEANGLEVTYDKSAWETAGAAGETAFFCSGGDCAGLMCRAFNDFPGFEWPAAIDKASLQSVDAWLLNLEKSNGGQTAQTVEPTNAQTLGGRQTLVNIMSRALIDDGPSTVVYVFRRETQTGLLKCNGAAKSVSAARARMDALAAGTKFIAP
jgi:hypothetical protein